SAPGERWPLGLQRGVYRPVNHLSTGSARGRRGRTPQRRAARRRAAGDNGKRLSALWPEVSSHGVERQMIFVLSPHGRGRCRPLVLLLAFSGQRMLIGQPAFEVGADRGIVLGIIDVQGAATVWR